MATFNELTPSDKFFKDYAVALLIWQAVEASVYEFFSSMFHDPQNFKQVGAAYYSQDAFGAKLKMVDKVAAVVLDPEHMKRWGRLKDRIVDAYAERNVLAHFSAAVDGMPGEEQSIALTPHPYIPIEIQKKRTTKYDAAQCRKLASDFGKITNELRDFVNFGNWVRKNPASGGG